MDGWSVDLGCVLIFSLKKVGILCGLWIWGVSWNGFGVDFYVDDESGMEWNGLLGETSMWDKRGGISRKWSTLMVGGPHGTVNVYRTVLTVLDVETSWTDGDFMRFFLQPTLGVIHWTMEDTDIGKGWSACFQCGFHWDDVIFQKGASLGNPKTP